MDWREYLKPGMTVVDIGANIGSYSSLFKDSVGPSGVVIAIEPNPAAITQLCGAQADRILQLAITEDRKSVV